MNKLITLLTALGLILGSVPCIADEYDVPPVEVDDVLSPSEKPDSEDVNEDPKQEGQNENTETAKSEDKNTDKSDEADLNVNDKNNYDYKTDEILKDFNSKDVYVNVFSKYNGKNISEKLRNSKIISKREVQKKELKNFLDNILSTISSGVFVKNKTNEDLNNLFEKSSDGIYFSVSDSNNNKYEILVVDNRALTWFGEFKLDNKIKDEFADDLKYIRHDGFGLYNFIDNTYQAETEGTFDFENLKMKYSNRNWEDIKLSEKLSFDIKVNKEFEKTVICDLSDIGNNVKCTLTHYKGSGHYFVLTIEGSREKKSYVIEKNDFAWGNGSKLFFETNYYLDSKGNYIYDPSCDADRIYVFGKAENNKIAAAIKYVPINNNYRNIDVSKLTFNNAVKADNVNFEVSSANINLSLTDLWGLPETKEEYIKQQEEKNNEEKTDNQKDDNKTEDKPKDDIKETEKVKFEDVPENHWAYDDILSLAEKKIILGYGDGRFGTNDSVTSEQVSLLLDRLFEYKTDDTAALPAKRESIIVSIVKALNADVSGADVSVINEKFNDCETINAEDRQYIAYAIDAGLVKGYDGKLNPEDNVTRAETAALLCRALKIEK